MGRDSGTALGSPAGDALRMVFLPGQLRPVDGRCVVKAFTALLALLPFAVACSPQPSAPDMSPVGGGLAVIGLGIVLAAFVVSLLHRKGGDRDE